MIQLTDFTKVIDTYKKNFDIRNKKFSDKKKKDIKEKREEREKKIESNKIFSLKRTQKKVIGKSEDILDTAIRFAGFTLLGLIVKNLDKIVITVKTIIEKIKEFAIKAKKFFDERVAPFLKDVFNLGKDIFDVFVGIGDFLIDLNPFKDFDSEFNILLRGILGFAAKLGELNAPKGKLPGSTILPSEEPAKTPAKTPAKVSVRERAKALRQERFARSAQRSRFAQRILTRSRALVSPGAGIPASPAAGIPAGANVSDPLVFKTFTQQLEELQRAASESKVIDNPITRKSFQLKDARDAAALKKLGIERGDKFFRSNIDQIMDDDPIKPGQKITSLEKLLGKPPKDLKRAPEFIQKGKNALGDFMKSLRSKVDDTGNALKKLGATKIPGIGILDKIPMSARRFVGRSLRLLGLFMLAREVEQDFRNGDINAVVVKLSAYGLGWLVTSAGLIGGSLLGISGVGTVAGVAVLAGSIGAGAGTEMLVRKLLLEEKEKESDSTPAKVKPKVPAVVAPKQTPNITPNPNKRADEDNYDSGGNKIKIGDTVGYDISRGLNSSTTYDNQGMMISREVVIAIQPVEIG